MTQNLKVQKEEKLRSQLALTAGRSKQIARDKCLKKSYSDRPRLYAFSDIVQGGTTADHPLIEDTYIEVDLENQHMWFYKDGKVALETDIVSGKPSTPTPSRCLLCLE